MQKLYVLNNGRTVTARENPQDFLINQLVEKMKRLGRAPSFEEVEKDQNMVSPNAFSEYFKTFDNAIENATIKYERELRGGDCRKASINPKYANTVWEGVNPSFF